MTNFTIKIGKLLVYLFFFCNLYAQENLVKNPSLEDTLSIRPFRAKYNGLGDHFLNCKYWYNSEPVIYNNNSSHNYIKLKSRSIISYHDSAHAEIKISYNKHQWYFNGFIIGTLKEQLKKDSLYNISYFFKSKKEVAFSNSKLSFNLSDTYVINVNKEYYTPTNIVYTPAEKGWTKGSATYKAKGNEAFIIVGYFKNNLNSLTKNKKHRKKPKLAITLVDLVTVEPMFETNKANDIAPPPFSSKEIALYFEHDTFLLSETNKKLIQSLLIDSNFNYKKAAIYGYASKIGNKKYNLELAKKRIDKVQQFLNTINNSLDITSEPYGMQHDLKGDDENHRKVKIVFE